jgi:HK97 family phage prohead protease
MTELTAPARNDLCRSVPFTLTRTDGEAEGDGLTFEGYGAVFNSPTRIDSWEGTFDEQIAPGAFKKSIRERTPRLQFDHGYHPLIGSIPIGRITDITEDTRGLFVQARLSDNWLVQPIRDAISEGSVDGMSFRFSVVREDWQDNTGKSIKSDELMNLLWEPGDRGPLLRTLKEVKMPEVGPVVWPAYQDTTASVRSKVIDLGRLSEPAQRRLLAEAVLLADAAERTQAEEEPPVTVEADVHPDEAADTPQATDPEPAGEHESNPERGMRPVDLWVRKARDIVLTAEKKGKPRV